MPDRSAPVIYVSIVQQGHAAKQRLDVSDSVISLTFEDGEHEAAKLTLTVNNHNLANFDTPIWRKGTKLEASWGYVGDTTPTYSSVIQVVKGFNVLQIEALSLSILMHKKQKIRKWTEMTRSQVVQLVAAENGYSGDQLHLDDTGVVLPVIHQIRETDAQLLSRLARAEGWKFSIDYDGLHFHDRKLSQAPLRIYEWFGGPGAGDIIGYPSIENDVTVKPASVTTKGRDPLAKKDFEITADNTTPRTGLAEAIEIVDPITGVQTFQVGTGQSTIEPSSDLNEATAKRRVQGVYKNAQMTTVLMSLPVVGDPRVRAKSIVNVKGIRTLSGNYFVAKARDTVSATGGFTQALSLRRDGRSEIYPKAAVSGAVQNTKAPATDTGALSPLERVNPITGETETVFVDSRGREQGN